MNQQLKTVVTQEDLALFRKANENVQRALDTQRFVHAHLEEVYQVGPAGTFDTITGIISRPTPPAPIDPPDKTVQVDPAVMN